MDIRIGHDGLATAAWLRLVYVTGLDKLGSMAKG
jgi:hypothetical protein